ncbi:hypothetical protein NY08_1663 [Rhodococcus sp. B7740]|nr:hypothetical protein NY08_1663 [Rhodococcus sp. B7740]
MLEHRVRGGPMSVSGSVVDRIAGRSGVPTGTERALGPSMTV